MVIILLYSKLFATTLKRCYCWSSSRHFITFYNKFFNSKISLIKGFLRQTALWYLLFNNIGINTIKFFGLIGNPTKDLRSFVCLTLNSYMTRSVSLRFRNYFQIIVKTGGVSASFFLTLGNFISLKIFFHSLKKTKLNILKFDLLETVLATQYVTKPDS